MKQQFAVTHRYTILQETEKDRRILSRKSVKHFVFLREHKDKQFGCGHKIMTEGLFLTPTSCNAGIPLDVLCEL